MKTICTLNGKIVMSQDGDCLASMQSNASQYPGAVAEVVTDDMFAILRAANTPAPTYADLRRAEYPPMVELIDGLVKDDPIQVQAYKDACLAVKAKYPKP